MNGKVSINIQLNGFIMESNNCGFSNVLVYIEPWIEDSKPGWKKDYIWWFGDLIKEIKSHYHNKLTIKFIIGDDLTYYWQQNNNCFADMVEINQDELQKVFPDAVSALKGWLREDYTDGQLSEMAKLIESKLDGFSPDVIFTITPSPFLKHLYPQALILNRDALYCREPWPDELTCLDPCGINTSSIINVLSDEFKNIKNDTESYEFVQHIRTNILNDVNSNSFYKDKINSLKDNYKNLILLPLQSNGHYNFYCATDFRNQFDYLCFVLSVVPKDVGIIVTNHPDDKTLNERTLAYLKRKFMNFIYIDGIENHHSPSQFILPHVDALICVSSGLCYQAMIWEKPVYIVGKSHFRNIFKSIDELTDNSDFEKVNYSAIVKWLLTHYFASYSYIKNGKWLGVYIERMMLAIKSERITLESFSMIDTDVNIMQNFEEGKREIRLLKPGVSNSNHQHSLNQSDYNKLKSEHLSLTTELEHYKKAYREAISVQDHLKNEVVRSRKKGILWWLRRK